MKVLHLISSSGMYGAEAVILTLLRYMQPPLHTSALCVFRNASEPVQLYDRARGEGLEVYAISCRGPLDPSVHGAIRMLVKQSGADLVHAHGYKADVYLYLALRTLHIPFVSTCHTWYDNSVPLRLYGVLDRLVLRSFTRVAAVSEQVQQRLLDAGVPRERIAFIRNGVDLSSFGRGSVAAEKLLAGQPLCVGLVGRLDEEKGVDIFLRAAAAVLQQLPQTRFVVAGDGPARDRLQAMIDEFGISHNARLLGRQEDMPSLYASLDLLVSSSRLEGLPITLLEAMASGLPIVAAAVGAVPEVIHDGKTGLLVVSEDVPALTQKILKLLRSPAERARLSSAAKRLVTQEFSAERMTADYIKFYDRALERGRDSAL